MARRRRIYNERVEREAYKPKHCMDCGIELGIRARSKRCQPCRALDDANRAKKFRQKRAKEIAAGGAAAKEAESRRRFTDRIKSVYAMTIEQYDALVSEQDGHCAICRLSPVGRGKTDNLVVDHCHRTGDNRGLLCGNCNIAIGLLCDDPAIVRLAAEYLERHRDREPALPRR